MLEKSDIEVLQKLGIIFPVKITIINGEKKFKFPKNGELVSEWKWIKDIPPVSPEKLLSVLGQYSLAMILNETTAVIDTDCQKSFEYTWNWLESQGINFVIEKSLSNNDSKPFKNHFWFTTKQKLPYCLRFSQLGWPGNAEILGGDRGGHLVFLNENGWILNPSECTFPELPEINMPANNVIQFSKSETFPQGQRNNHLASIAGSLRRKNVSMENIYKCLLIINSQCEPPLNDFELQAISKSISRYEPQPINDFTDLKLKMKGAI